VRERLALRPGDRLSFVIHDDGTVTIEAETVDLPSLKGVVKSGARHVSVEQMDDAIKRGATRGVIALDTNVLVRYLVEDDAKQTALAAALIERAIADDESLYVSDVVVCETVWVLSVAYKFAAEGGEGHDPASA
jgi:hypothetical protein